MKYEGNAICKQGNKNLEKIKKGPEERDVLAKIV
jgi:hypothetical protein